MPDIVLAHGVGRVYELPVPLWLYLIGSGATVLASFAIRILAPGTRELKPPRRIAGSGAASAVAIALRVLGLVVVALSLGFGVTEPGRGLTTATLLFWVGLVMGMVVIAVLIAGAWAAADPWTFLASGEEVEGERTAPWVLGPLSIYALFWFELISGAGFEGRGVVLALVLYTVYTVLLRTTYRGGWKHADPLYILFGFASRSAPLELETDEIRTRSPLLGLDEREPMPIALFTALFMLMASTTLDNVRETHGWASFMDSTGLVDLPSKLVDSIALPLFALLFFLPFMATMYLANKWLSESRGLADTARRFGWSLVPIAVAYVLAHNVSLLAIGFPRLLNELTGAFGSYIPSPRFVWIAEILLIVGGHILGVLVAHRSAVRLEREHRGAVKSQYALTVLMSLFTITTLWLLAQPLVSG